MKCFRCGEEEALICVPCANELAEPSVWDECGPGLLAASKAAYSLLGERGFAYEGQAEWQLMDDLKDVIAKVENAE